MAAEIWLMDPAILLISRYAAWRRRKDGIWAVSGRKPELSCIMFGEFRNLLDAQLLTTPEFQDGWLELRNWDGTADKAIAKGVLLEIRKDILREAERGAADKELLAIAADLGRLLAD